MKSKDYRARIFEVGGSGSVKESNFKAGYHKGIFRIYIGKEWEFWKYLDMESAPKDELIDEEKRVYYLKIKDGNDFIFRQIKRVMNIKDEDLLTPVESDVKLGTIKAIIKVKKMLTPDSIWQKIGPLLGYIAILIMFIVGYAMLINAGG